MTNIHTYIFFHCVQDQRLKLVQAVVYPRSPSFLHNRLVTLQQIEYGLKNLHAIENDI